MTMCEVFTRKTDLLDYVRMQKKKGNTIGFVPTMGALHEGHASLLKQSSVDNACTVLSIFVNPKQFGPKEDFSKYPRTFQADVDIAKSNGVSAVFAPPAMEIYPEGFSTTVSLPFFSEFMCGTIRPGHFDGVATVVLLLLNLVQADTAYFGMKDFQQLALIKRMCADLAHPTKIRGMPTLREPDGLAMSSRNRYLDAHARTLAAQIPKALSLAARAMLQGEKNTTNLLTTVQASLSEVGLLPQYLEFRDANTLKTIEESFEKPVVLAIAQFVESEGVKTRLIDNIIFGDDEFHRGLLRELIEKNPE